MPAPFTVEDETNGKNLWSVDTGGNVNQLGDLLVQGSETVNGNQTIAGNQTVTGTQTIGSQSVSSLTVSGNATVGGTLGVTGATTLGATGTGALTVTGAATVSTTLGVTGASTLTGNTTVGGTLGVTGAATHTSTTALTGLATASAGVNYPAIATPATPTTSSTLYAATGTNLPAYVSPSGQVAFVGGVVQAQTSTTTVANTTSITALTSYTVPANDVAAGAVYRITGFGVYSWTATPTIDLTLVWGGAGGTALATIPVITLGTAQTNATFSYKALVVARSTTSVWGELEWNLGATSAADVATTYVATPTGATAITSTGSNALVVAVTWGAASSSNTISLTGGMVERIA